MYLDSLIEFPWDTKVEPIHLRSLEVSRFQILSSAVNFFFRRKIYFDESRFLCKTLKLLDEILCNSKFAFLNLLEIDFC